LEFLGKNFLIQKLVEHLNAMNLANPIILFGSYAKGYANEESDIDLFVLGKIPENQLAYIKKFEATYGKQINVKTASMENFEVGLNSDILIREVIKDHIVLSNPDPFVSILWRSYVERRLPVVVL
jgi:predicted nucleotidyltransferase